MEKKRVKKILADKGIEDADLAKKMGVTVDELNAIISKEDTNHDFLKKIEKTLGCENLFYINEYGDNNIIGDNNVNDNSAIILQKLLEIVKTQNDTIKELNKMITQLSQELPNSKTRNNS